MKYRNHDTRAVLLSKQYCEHVAAMTVEALHGKCDIAEELAARDLELARMQHRIERLRGMLKTNAGWWYELSDYDKGDICMEVAGDMEPPLMGSND